METVMVVPDFLLCKFEYVFIHDVFLPRCVILHLVI
jgi:hypothetical protein